MSPPRVPPGPTSDDDDEEEVDGETSFLASAWSTTKLPSSSTASPSFSSSSPSWPPPPPSPLPSNEMGRLVSLMNSLARLRPSESRRLGSKKSPKLLSSPPPPPPPPPSLLLLFLPPTDEWTTTICDMDDARRLSEGAHEKEEKEDDDDDDDDDGVREENGMAGWKPSVVAGAVVDNRIMAVAVDPTRRALVTALECRRCRRPRRWAVVEVGTAAPVVVLQGEDAIF